MTRSSFVLLLAFLTGVPSFFIQTKNLPEVAVVCWIGLALLLTLVGLALWAFDRK